MVVTTRSTRRPAIQLFYAALLVAGSIAMVVAPRLVHAQAGGIAVGATAPGAAVVRLDGTPADLSRWVGHGPVVLEFWATWCPLCRELAPALSAARTKYADRVTFVAVGVANNQSPERQQAYATAHAMGGEMVFDRDGKAVAAYKAPHTSYVVVIDAGGRVVYTGVGGDQDIDAAVARAVPAVSNAMSPAGR